MPKFHFVMTIGGVHVGLQPQTYFLANLCREAALCGVLLEAEVYCLFVELNCSNLFLLCDGILFGSKVGIIFLLQAVK